MHTCTCMHAVLHPESTALRALSLLSDAMLARSTRPQLDLLETTKCSHFYTDLAEKKGVKGTDSCLLQSTQCATPVPALSLQLARRLLGPALPT